MTESRVYAMSIATIYPLYVQKALRKDRAKIEVDEIIRWLTGYDQVGLEAEIARGTALEDFFAHAPQLNPLRRQITGIICGVRVEEIKDPIMQEIRYMDKLVDELAKGKPMEKILRSA